MRLGIGQWPGHTEPRAMGRSPSDKHQGALIKSHGHYSLAMWQWTNARSSQGLGILLYETGQAWPPWQSHPEGWNKVLSAKCHHWAKSVTAICTGIRIVQELVDNTDPILVQTQVYRPWFCRIRPGSLYFQTSTLSDWRLEAIWQDTLQGPLNTKRSINQCP